MTFSIIARCPHSGQFGVAAATAMPAVGKLLSHAAAGAGAVATQAQVNPYLGLDGLDMLRHGLSAQEALQRLRSSDPCMELRQCALIDARGDTVCWTGDKCIPWAGSLTGEQFSVQGNRLVGPQVLEAVAGAFRQAPERPLIERLIEALAAGDRCCVACMTCSPVKCCRRFSPCRPATIRQVRRRKTRSNARWCRNAAGNRQATGPPDG